MNTFNILGDIVQDDSQRWFESDVVPAMVVGWLKKQEGDVEININSLGGSVTGGLAIANAFKGYDRGKVTANILGVAASMASVIACAADEVRMGAGAFMMIHNPWGSFTGEADELRKQADLLDQMKASLIGFYQTKFDKTADELAALMDAETWIEAEKAAEYGLSVAGAAPEFAAAARCNTRMLFAAAPAAAAAFYAHQEKPVETPAEETPVETPAEETPVETPAEETPAEETPAEETPAETPAVEASGEEATWEARYKGASRKLNEIKAQHAAAIDMLAAVHEKEIQGFERQIAAVRGELETAKADLSSAVNRANAAEAELAACREQLNQKEKAHALLTGGVLSPAQEGSSYAAQMDAARTPAEREKLRALKKAGKIK